MSNESWIPITVKPILTVVSLLRPLIFPGETAIHFLMRKPRYCGLPVCSLIRIPICTILYNVTVTLQRR